MGGFDSLPKQFLQISGKEIIVRTIERFQECADVDAIYVACHPDWIDFLNTLVEKWKLTKVLSVVPGGATGQLSIFNGLLEAEKRMEGPDDVVLIHDGVRPVINDDLIRANIQAARERGAAVSCSAAQETILLLDGEENLSGVCDRSRACYAKAPQTFRLPDILSWHRKAREEGRDNFIDSCSMAMHYGCKPHLVPCSSDNIKVTTPKDFYILKALVEYQAGK